MPADKGSHLNIRKPFKLLARLEKGELKGIRGDLQQRIEETSGKLYPKLLVYYERCIQLKVVHEPVTHAQFVKGTNLPSAANAFDKLTSLFYNYLQEYLARRELLSDPVALQRMAFRAYRNRPFEWKEIRRRYGEAQRELGKLPQSSHLSNERLMLDLDLAIHASDRSIPQDERGYPELLAALEANYAIQKLRLLCAVANDRRIFKSRAEDLANSASVPPLRDTWPPLAKMYYGVYQVLNGEDNEVTMGELRTLLDQQDINSATYPREDMMDLYGYLLNALARKLNDGDQVALKDLSLLHDHLLENGILLEDGQIPAAHFKNVISVKLKNREVAAARMHFDALADKISGDPDENALRYNHTLLLYAEQHLEKAAKELEVLCEQAGNLKLDLFYGLDIRANLLKVYYDILETEKTNPFLWDETDEKMVRLLEAFRGYIERKKIPEYRREAYELLRRLIHDLYFLAFRQETSASEEELKELESRIKDNNNTMVNWFVNRLERLAKN